MHANSPILLKMDIDSSKSIRSLKAYQLFLAELDRHVAELDGTFQGESSIDAFIQSENHNRFHKIKGGAGFFGLTEIADIAGLAEALFEKPLDQLAGQIDDIKELVDRIKELATHLPPPVEGTK